MNKDKRIRIIIGHYGSGKTEFSLNYALKLNELGKKVAIADLDVVNLYFRSREKATLLEEKGIKIIGASIKGNALDLPAISGEVLTPIQDKSYDTILDVGGDPAGARALGRYHEYFVEGQYDMFFVLNVNRPETGTVEKALEFIRKIEDTSRAKVTGIINNTHLLKSTTIEDVIKGYQLSLELSELTGIPLKYNVALEELATLLPNDLVGEIFPIRLYMREEWMN
jgi:MinD-like ATPase involved in chromosome partitioning or flagellar assembly